MVRVGVPRSSIRSESIVTAPPVHPEPAPMGLTADVATTLAMPELIVMSPQETGIR